MSGGGKFDKAIADRAYFSAGGSICYLIAAESQGLARHTMTDERFFEANRRNWEDRVPIYLRDEPAPLPLRRGLG